MNIDDKVRMVADEEMASGELRDWQVVQICRALRGARDERDMLKMELQELRLQMISNFGQEQMICEDADKAWEQYTGGFDMNSNEWQDKGCDEVYKAGFKAGVSAYSQSKKDEYSGD